MSEFDGPGLYIHVPFCTHICPYCDFSVLTGDRSWQTRYLQHLSLEIELLTESGWPELVREPPSEAFDTIYFGGGTPSMLPPGNLESILEAVRAKMHVREDAWLFLEANPEDVTLETATTWRQMGFRTISLGVQSFAEDNLAFLGRQHSPRAARRGLDNALAAGFDTVAMDLIYGIPDQSPRAWQNDLDEALAAGPHHLSCYQLTVHPRTPFGFRQLRGELMEMDNDDQAELFMLTHRHLAAGGMPGYEVSNFAAGPQHRSLHNQKYWSHSPYLGLGPSAHSFARGRRWWNPRKIKAWMAPLDAGRPPLESAEELGLESLVLESLMLGLRTYAGVDFDNLPGGLGPALWRDNRATIDELVKRGLAIVDRSRLRPTLGGLAIADTVARSLDLGCLRKEPP
ncbi:MAG: radical SAM family heme chaperone HemW [Thermoanaerobaculia bacterium]